MPLGYEHLLPRILGAEIIQRHIKNPTNDCVSYAPELETVKRFNKKFQIITKAEENVRGVPQGGIISPMLMN